MQWATLTGDDSYNFTSLLPYFKKSAHFTPADAAARASNATVPAPHASAFTASGGPLEVSFPPFAMPFSSWGLPALREVGIPTLKDLSSGDLLGAQYSTFTVDPKDGSRSSSESSFLQSAFASERTNLKIYPRSMAKQILFNSKKAATGVRVNTNGAEYILSAQNEVILSGGVVSTINLLFAFLIDHLEIVRFASNLNGLWNWTSGCSRKVQYSYSCRQARCWPKHVGM